MGTVPLPSATYTRSFLPSHVERAFFCTLQGLRTIHWDDNLTTGAGLREIATALNGNKTVLSMPIPLADICKCMSAETIRDVERIQDAIAKNHSP